MPGTLDESVAIALGPEAIAKMCNDSTALGLEFGSADGTRTPSSVGEIALAQKLDIGLWHLVPAKAEEILFGFEVGQVQVAKHLLGQSNALTYQAMLGGGHGV